MEIERISHTGLKSLTQRQFILPTEHGAWIFLFSPLLIGLILGGRFTPASGLVVVAAVSAFLVRQPVTMLVKISSGRRPRRDLPPTLFWMGAYGLLSLLSLVGLVYLGYAFILLGALPAIPVLGWHLWLVSRRAERLQMAVELAGSAVLALAAPAAYWVGKGALNATGGLLWVLCWLQTAGTIVYTYLRLKQRRLKVIPAFKESLAMGLPALLVNVALFLLAVILAALAIIPPWAAAAFLIQALEVVWGIWHPAVQAKPGAIGTRQLVVSLLFTGVFILAWL